jgi:acyl-CoA thioesterase I
MAWSLLLAQLFVCSFGQDQPTTPSPEKRLVVVGDSITVGVGASSPAHRYSTVLTDLLRREDSQIVEVNLGGSGGSLSQQSADYAETILKQGPEIVVIQWGVNDNSGGYSVGRYAAAYERVVAGLRAAKPKLRIVATTLVPDFREGVDAESWIGEANVVIQEIAARFGCHLADIHRAFDHRRSLYADTIHPNDDGARVMADTIFRALHETPASADHARVNMDTAGQKRFLQYLFTTRPTDAAPHWVEVSGLSPQGMSVTTEVPLDIRTASIYEGGEYTVILRDEQGIGMSTNAVMASWQRTIPIQIDPQGRRRSLTVDISATGKL